MTRRLNKDQVEKLIDELGEFKRRGEWYNFVCPFHHGDNKNFGINIGDDRYFCFSCGVSGTLRGLSEDLRTGDATGYSSGHLARRRITVGVSPDGQGGHPVVGPVSGATDLDYGICDYPVHLNELNKCPGQSGTRFATLSPENFSDHYLPLNRSYNASPVLTKKIASYLIGRGLLPETCPCGVLVHDTISGRVTFPIYHEGKPVYFQARSVFNQQPKTLNPKEADGWLPKTRVLWNYDQIRRGRTLYVCEGIFDALAVQHTMKEPATCVLGSTISGDQIRLIGEKMPSRVVVFMDSDADSKALTMAEAISRCGLATWCIQWKGQYGENDPASIDRTTMYSLLKRAIRANSVTILRACLESI